MRTIIVLVMILLSMLLSGCATMQVQQQVWYKVGADEEQTRKDFHQCDYESTMATPAPIYGGLVPIMMQAMNRKELMGKCLRAKGYNLVDKDWILRQGGQIRAMKDM